MKLKISTPQYRFLIYLIAGFISLFPLLIYGISETSSIGFYVSIVFILICRRSFFAVICFLYIIMSNIYMQYVPLKYLGGITVTALANLMIIGVFLLYFFQTRGFKSVRKCRYNSLYCLFLISTIVWYMINGYIYGFGSLQILWRLVPLYFSTILITAVCKEQNYIYDILSVIIVSALLFTLIAYIELFRERTFFYSLWTGSERYRNGILRVGSTQGDPNVLGIFLAPSIFIIMNGKVKGLIGKKITNTILFFMILMLILTNSRMTLVSFVIGIGVNFWMQGKQYKKSLVICGVTLALLISPGLFAFMFRYQAASSGQRIMLLGEAIKYWMSSPFLGIGLDQFNRKSEWLTMNEYAKQLAEFGIFGFVLYISFYIIMIKTFFKNKRYLKKERLYNASCILAAIIVFMANSFSLDSYFYFIMWIFPVLTVYFFVIERKSLRGAELI